jgi:hypothetical protein
MPMTGSPVAPNSTDATAVQTAHVVHRLTADGEVPGALHVLAVGWLGIPMVDGADAEELATVCAEQSRHTFLFVVAVPRILGTTGLPVNPLAIF